MSWNHGLLLYDVADEPIGNWRENLGTRGTYDLWELVIDSRRVELILIESLEGDGEGLECPCEACEKERKQGGHNDEDQLSEATLVTADDVELICEAGCYNYVLAHAKNFMKKYPDGYSNNHDETI